jgi:hypothetical protein
MDDLDESSYIRYPKVLRSRVSSGSTVSDYGLDDRAIGVHSPPSSAEVENE